MKQILCALLVVMTVVSCKKKDETQSGQDILRSGKWKQSGGKYKLQSAVAQDTTINYFNETSLWPDCKKDNYIVFKTNFDGVIDNGDSKCGAEDPQQESITWELTNSERTLNIRSGKDFFNTDNVQAEVINLSSSLLAIRYTVYVHNPTDPKFIDTVTFSNSYTNF